MTTNILLLRSSVAQKRPSPASLLDGQMALNLNVSEPGAYFRLTDGSLTKIGPVAITSSGNPPNSAAAGPTGNVAGETWLDGRLSYTSPVLKVFNGTQWVTSSGFSVDNVTGNYSLAKSLTVTSLIANGTGPNAFVRLPNGPLADEAAIAAAPGMVRFDTTTGQFRGYDGVTWSDLGSGSIGGNLNVGGDAVVGGNLTVDGNTILGNDCGTDTLTVNSQTALNCNTTVGLSSTNNLDINSLSDFRSNVRVSSQANLRFHSGTATTSNWVGFRAPGSVPSSTLWTLPAADGSTGQVLSTNGTGTLGWITPSGGGGGSSVTVGDSAPVSPAPANGDLWYNSLQGRLFVYYTDPNTNQWVDASPTSAVPSSSIQDGAVTTPKLADLAVTTQKIANNSVTIAKFSFNNDLLPTADNSYDIGSPTARIANIYTGDLHLANERGDWTVIEEEDYLSLRNNKIGKTFKIVMEAVN